MRARKPKHFKVDWIPEQAGRKLVRTFAMIVYMYKDTRGKRLDNLTMAYQPDGSTIQFTLYTNPETEFLDEAEREDEPDPPALHPPPEGGRKKVD